MTLKFEQDKKYETKSGNELRCLAVQKAKDGKDIALCAYTKISCEGHEGLLNVAQEWNLDGGWKQFPGGIHDVVKAL